MKRPLSSRFIAAAVLACTALGAASVAQARPDVLVSIGLPGLPGLPPLPGLPVFVPAPVYAHDEPVYVQPRPVYVPPREIGYERSWRPSYRADLEREREWRRAEWQRREWQRHEWERRHHDRSPSHGRDWD